LANVTGPILIFPAVAGLSAAGVSLVSSTAPLAASRLMRLCLPGVVLGRRIICNGSGRQ